MNLGDWIRFPTVDKNWLVKILIGGVINLVPIINLISWGYYAEVMRSTLDGEPVMPEWDNFGAKFMGGLKLAVITFIYMLIPTAIGVAAAAAGSSDLSSGISVGLLTVTALIALLFGFMVPMALVFSINSSSLVAAFDFPGILWKIMAVFGQYCLIYLGVIAASLILMVMNIIPLVGLLVMMFLYFYMGVVISGIFAELFNKASVKQIIE